MSEAAARAKVNLRHRVFARDEWGYHGVETLLARTSLHDTLRLEEHGEGIAIEVAGPCAAGVPDGPANLCWTAAERFLAAAFPKARSRPGVRIRLTKRIPQGTGLGGGSADAAATLRLLRGRWPRVSERGLVAMAGAIGSDVPFGLLDVPLALGWERGRRLLPLRPPPPAPALFWVPIDRVATPDAYRRLHEMRAPGDEEPGGAACLPGTARLARWESIRSLMRNDLEAAVFVDHPELEDDLELLRSVATRGAAMTGSGSALYAIFETDEERVRARDRIAEVARAAEASLIDVTLPV